MLGPAYYLSLRLRLISCIISLPDLNREFVRRVALEKLVIVDVSCGEVAQFMEPV